MVESLKNHGMFVSTCLISGMEELRERFGSIPHEAEESDDGETSSSSSGSTAMEGFDRRQDPVAIRESGGAEQPGDDERPESTEHYVNGEDSN